MVYKGKPYEKWVIWGYHYFWRHPYRNHKVSGFLIASVRGTSLAVNEIWITPVNPTFITPVVTGYNFWNMHPRIQQVFFWPITNNGGRDVFPPIIFQGQTLSFRGPKIQWLKGVLLLRILMRAPAESCHWCIFQFSKTRQERALGVEKKNRKGFERLSKK